MGSSILALALSSWALLLEPADGSTLACTDAAALDERIEGLVGRPVEPDEVVVRVHVLEPMPLRARVEIEFGGRTESRALEARDCDALLDAVALLVAVTLDPTEVPPAPEPPEPPEPEPAPEPPEPEPPEPEPEPAPDPERPALEPEPPEPAPPPSPPPRPAPPSGSITLAAGLLGGGEIGAIPRGTGGIRPTLRLTVRRLTVELAGDYWVRRRHRVLDTGETITVELGVAALRIGGLVGQGRVRVPIGGGLEAGSMRGAAFGLREARADRWPWLAGLAWASVLVRVGRRVDLTATLEGVVPLVRPTFTATRDDGAIVSLYTPSPVGARALAGVTVALLSVTDRRR